METTEQEYEVAVIITAEAYLTVYAESEADAIDQARDQWSYIDLQNGSVDDVLINRNGVYS